MARPLADYQEHCQAFAALLEPACRSNILLFSGESGSGKTTLVTTCLGTIPDRIESVAIDLRSSANTLPEIFRLVGHRLGWAHLRTFANQVAALQGMPPVEVDGNWLAGIRNHIHVALQVENATDREERRAILTEAWFADLGGYARPLLIAFDSYEHAIPSVQAWIDGPFLARAAQTDCLRVLVAGQQVPDPNTIAWGGCCVHHHLYGVPEAKHWLPVVEALGRYVPAPDPLSWLAGICHALRGTPKDIMQVIEGLPQKEGGV